MRNRASPFPLVIACKGLDDPQRDAIRVMGFGSFLDIRCLFLHNPVINWLATMSDVDSRELVIPRRGRIPTTEESVERILGISRGDEEVVYQVDSDSEERMAMLLFGGQSNMPKTTEVGKMLDGIKDAGERF